MLELKINSPATVVEGESYLVWLTVTNQSIKAGLPVEATLGVGISAATEFTTLIPPQITDKHFGPGEIKMLSYPMDVPMGSSGETGVITAWIEDPTGRAIASASEDVIIVSIAAVTVYLKNPPGGANEWQIRIIDDVGIKTLAWYSQRGEFEDTAIFEFLANEWLFPLSVDITIYEEWQENTEWHKRQLYYVQSHHPKQWDWDTESYTGPPDPTYRAVFIPDYGNYYFNVATERFEKI